MDIIKIKNYITEKFNDSSDDDRAQILSNAVHRIVDHQLPNMENSYRTSIRKSLINKAITNGESMISLYDVFESCVSISNRSSAFFECLVQWVNKNVVNKVTVEEIQHYISEIQKPVEQKASIRKEIQVESVVKLKGFRLRNKFEQINGKYVLGMTALILIILFNLMWIKIPYPSTIAKISMKSNLVIGTYASNILRVQHAKYSAIPDNFRYKNINTAILKKYLMSKKSLLGTDPYFSNIISVAREYNVNPLVLFAIAGQEQGFVPRFASASRAIINNPFNVYHSWRAYNTNITDTTKIVCSTLINLCNGRPKGVDAFSWINRKYAEDQNWAHGVSLIYNRLEKNNGTRLLGNCLK